MHAYHLESLIMNQKFVGIDTGPQKKNQDRIYSKHLHKKIPLFVQGLNICRGIFCLESKKENSMRTERRERYSRNDSGIYDRVSSEHTADNLSLFEV